MIHKHFKTKAKFNEELAKNPSGVSDSDICFIKETGEIWTHGKFYAGSDALIESKANKSEMSVVDGTGANADKTTITLKSGTSATVLKSHQSLAGKQDVISDLETIRSGAALGATAVQTETDPTVPSWAKQSSKPSYNASEVGALPSSTKYGATVDLSLNTTNYKLTISLKDQDGVQLNSKTVDFPIESVVVNGSYNNQTKKIILTLQSGSTIDVPVGDLVAGLQTEITSVSMLSADLVDDTNSTHKFVTAQEKTTWNNKSDFSGSYNDLTNKPTIPDVPSWALAPTKPTYTADEVGAVAPDEEDLTSVNVDGTDVIRFKDKDYSELLQTGFGRVYLRKNIVNGVNTLVQSMINKSNTIYIIQYDYDLNGSTITIPASCILKFEGGSLSNGTLIGSHTSISAGVVRIFNNITTQGDWIIEEVYPEWFGAQVDDISIDNATYINKALTAFKYGNKNITAYIPVVLTGGRYYTLSTINVTQLTTLKGKGFGTNGVVRVYDSTEEPVIYIYGQRFNVNNIYIWGSNTSTSERTKTGIQLGDGTLETSATRGILKNIVIQYCSIGLDLQRQWCNTIDTIHPTANLKGIVSRQGTSYLSNCQIETNKEVGVETITGGIKLISSIIEGNKYGCILNGSQHSFINCYFEANSEGEVNPDAEKQVIGGTDINPFYKDVNGGHIICGTDVRVKTLSIYDCVFSNGDSDQNKIYVDKCDQLNVEGGHLDVKELIITKNCVVGKLPVSYSDNTYNNFVNGGCKSSYPIYEVNDFRSFAVGGNSLLRLLSNSNDYFVVNGNMSYLYKDEDGGVISYRTSANSSYAREIQVKFNIDSFCDRTNDLYLEADYVIGPPNTMLTMSAKLAGSEEKALYGATPTSNVSPNKPFSLQIHVPKEDLLQKDNQDNYKYNLITVRAYTHEGDAFVDEATDKSAGYCFKLTRFAINEGNQIPSEAFNNLPSQARMKAHRFIASEGVILPVIDGEPTYNENEMLYVDYNTFKVVRKSTRTGNIVDAAGKTNAISVGATNARPTTLNYRDRGYLYYDLTLIKPVFFNNVSGKEWVEADGAIAGVKRIGTTSQRPTGGDIYVGFKYYDTTVNKELYASSISGNTVTWTEMTDISAYTGSVQSSVSANYISEPEVKSVKINGSGTNAASSSNCQIQYDTTEQCLKFTFN